MKANVCNAPELLLRVRGAAIIAVAVAAVLSLGPPGASAQPSGDCCWEHPTPGCEDAVCMDAVCTELPHCCDLFWDQGCVDAALSLPDCNCGGSVIIPPGRDCFETTAGSTRVQFGGGSEIPPLPADFFFPGSEPFEGVIELRGDPLPGYVGAVNTVIERKHDADLGGGQAQVEVELVELSLVSVEPIAVMDSAGPPEEHLYHVQITLNPEPGFESVGFMTIMGEAAGGEFALQSSDGGGIYIYPRFQFFEAWPSAGDVGPWDPPFPLLLEGQNPHPWQAEEPPLVCEPGQLFYPLPGVELLTVLDGGGSGEHGVIPPREVDGCCLPGGLCLNLDPMDCTFYFGQPMGQLCTGSIEACCLPDGTCMMADPLCCEFVLGGSVVWGGSCSSEQEACCGDFDPYGCTDADPLCCTETLAGWLPGEPACEGDVSPQNGVDDACETVQPTQACCLAEGLCLDLEPTECAAQGGTAQGPDSACVDMTIACCLPDGSCLNVDPLCCDDLNGTPGLADHCLGDLNSNGTDDACETSQPLQACCLTEGLCLDLEPMDCQAQGGTAQGPDSACVDMTIACCLPDGSCLNVDPLCCDDMGGTPGLADHCLGDLNSNGTDDACEVVMACCLPDGTCVDTSHDDCVNRGGDPQGPGTDCSSGAVSCSLLKWAQPPVFNTASPHPECFWGWDEPTWYAGQQIAADDWRCEDDRPVTDIHWWGSYWNWDDVQPPPDAPVAFHIGIWTDVPAGPGGDPPSHPDTMIWQWMVDRDALNERPVACDFHPAYMEAPEGCFRYDFQIPEAEWFWQEPGPTVYWVSISAFYPPGTGVDHVWGWKTRPHFDIDYAVKIWTPTAPEIGATFVEGAPIAEGWDLAFVITTQDVGAPLETKWIQPVHDGLSGFDVASGLWWNEDPQTSIKWEQPPDPAGACFYGWDEESAWWPGPGQIVADDWPCTDARPVSDIHWWGSYVFWNQDGPPPDAPERFHIGIWSDVPADDPGNPYPFSHPGEMLWEYRVPREELNETMVGCDEHPGHFPDSCFRYDLLLPPDQWFYQEPVGDPSVYWLSIAAEYDNGPPCACDGDINEDGAITVVDQLTVQISQGCPVGTGDRTCDRADINCDGVVDPVDLGIVQCQIGTWPPYADCCIDTPYGDGNPWGWKSRPLMYNDNAVRIFNPTDPVPGSMFDIGEPIYDNQGEAWDMSFVLTSTEEGVNRVVADDFISDGRPIRALRWWGSYLDETYAPDASGCNVEEEGFTGPWGPEYWCINTSFAVLAQSFTPANDFTLCKVKVWLRNGGGNVTLYVQDDASDSPGTIYTQATRQVGATEQWYEFDVPDVALAAGQEYFIRVGPGCMWCRFQDMDGGDPYPGGHAYGNGVRVDDEAPGRTDHMFMTYSTGAGAEPYVLDGWFISFHHAEPAQAFPGCPPMLVAGDDPTAVGVYYAPADAVGIYGLDMVDCFGHQVYEYAVDFARCCLLCSQPDPRTGLLPAQPWAFEETAELHYWMGIQAVVGVTWDSEAQMCGFEDRILTGHLPSPNTADGHFWGWHTSPADVMPNGPLFGACYGEVVGHTGGFTQDDCWEYDDWDKQIWMCPTTPFMDQVDMAFELLAPPWPVIGGVSSCIAHGGLATPYCLPIGLGDQAFDEFSNDHGSNVEPRLSGVKELRLTMTKDMDPATVVASNVQLSCTTGYTGTVAASLSGTNVVVLTLSDSLPHEDCCEVGLAGMTSAPPDSYPVTDKYYVARLQGDVSRDGITNTVDFSAIKARFGQTTTAANYVWDIKEDGIINSIDSSNVKPRFGDRIPDCP